LQNEAVLPVEIERLIPLSLCPGFPHLAGRAGARVDDVDPLVIGKEQRRAATA
jgi:hypothetical protein